MNPKINIRIAAVELVCYLFAALFVYAAVSKMLDFENFQVQLAQSSILGAYAGLGSYGIIIAELAVAVILLIPKLRITGLFASFALMSLFTVYIAIILNFSAHVPCSCGGILESMGWKGHLVFNIAGVGVAAAAITVYRGETARTILKLAALFAVCAGIFSMLHWTSSYLMRRENPFVRKFVPRSCIKSGQTALESSTLYFAGAAGGKIYIANQLSPLHVIAFDTALKTKESFKIELDTGQRKFRSVQLEISPPYFFVMDGSVPIIYRGKIRDWKAEPVMENKGFYFSKAVAADSSRIIFRGQLKGTRENILGLFSIRNKKTEIILHKELLQKQIDGIFDTDGMMNYSKEDQLFVYLYYYRNQYLAADNSLTLLYRANTIDTTATANLKPVYISNRGVYKLASADHAVNRLSAVRKKHLFVNSSLMGRYESKKMWNAASIIDVYDLNEKAYMSSFYIYDEGKAKMKDMLVYGNNVYAIAGMVLQRYELRKNLKINYNEISADSRGND